MLVGALGFSDAVAGVGAGAGDESTFGFDGGKAFKGVAGVADDTALPF